MPPRDEYTARRARWQQQVEQQARTQHLLGTVRVGLGILLAAVATISLGPAWISAWWLLAPTVPLVVLLMLHPARQRALELARRRTALYDWGLARLEDRWRGGGNRGEAWREPHHVYADDLDIFGRGSLFELLNAARTATGERTLADWLLRPGERAAVEARQPGVRELVAKLDLREDMAVLGDDVRAALDDRQLAAWGAAPAVHFFAGARPIAALLAILTAGAGIGWLVDYFSLRPFFYLAVMEILFMISLRRGLEIVVSQVNSPARELRLIAILLDRLEHETFSSAALQRLQAELRAGSAGATAQIRRLQRMLEWKEWAHNQIFGAIALPLLWIPQFAMAIEAWRQECGPHIAGWVAAVGEFEALASLAGFAYERPTAVFPELVEAEGPRYEAVALAHPLLDPAQAIANDVTLGEPGARMWVISGSNMSGKSTLLRAVGLSIVLGWAGAPVPAARARFTRLHVGASLRANDSIADHQSRFFAEITRLKQVVDLAGADGHMLFLLDELLSGTNSHDRRIGAEAILGGLLKRGAIGLATTHDLALAEMADGMGPAARNVHFEDQMEDGAMRWDYKLRPGVVRRSNAIALMRAIGLDV